MGVGLTAQDIETVARRVVELLRQIDSSQNGGQAVRGVFSERGLAIGSIRRPVGSTRPSTDSDPDATGATSRSRGRSPRRDACPTLLLTRKTAARSLGMSLSHFQRHVQPCLPCVHSGQLRLYRLHDLERWAETNLSEEHSLAA